MSQKEAILGPGNLQKGQEILYDIPDCDKREIKTTENNMKDKR